MLVFFSIPVLWEYICILNVRLGGETDQQNVMRKTYLNIFVKAFAQRQKCSSKELTLHVCYMYVTCMLTIMLVIMIMLVTMIILINAYGYNF